MGKPPRRRPLNLRGLPELVRLATQLALTRLPPWRFPREASARDREPRQLDAEPGVGGASPVPGAAAGDRRGRAGTDLLVGAVRARPPSAAAPVASLVAVRAGEEAAAPAWPNVPAGTNVRCGPAGDAAALGYLAGLTRTRPSTRLSPPARSASRAHPRAAGQGYWPRRSGCCVPRTLRVGQPPTTTSPVFHRVNHRQPGRSRPVPHPAADHRLPPTITLHVRTTCLQPPAGRNAAPDGEAA